VKHMMATLFDWGPRKRSGPPTRKEGAVGKTFGLNTVDWEERVNVDRLRTERLARMTVCILDEGSMVDDALWETLQRLSSAARGSTAASGPERQQQHKSLKQRSKNRHKSSQLAVLMIQCCPSYGMT